MAKAKFLLILLALACIYLFDTLFIVTEADQALILEFGKPVAVIKTPGLKSKIIPFVRKVVFYDKRLLDVESPAASFLLSDQKRIIVESYARYLIVDPLLFYQKLKSEAAGMTQINNDISSALRNVLGQVSLKMLLSEDRDKIMADIKKEVDAKFKGYGMEAVDIRITRADLPKETSRPIYERMRSDRVKEAKEYRAQGQELAQQIRAKADKDKVVILTEARKKAQVVMGEGDRVAARMWAEAAGRDKEFYQFHRSLQAYRNSLGEDTLMVLSPDSEFFNYFKRSTK